MKEKYDYENFDFGRFLSSIREKAQRQKNKKKKKGGKQK